MVSLKADPISHSAWERQFHLVPSIMFHNENHNLLCKFDLNYAKNLFYFILFIFILMLANHSFSIVFMGQQLFTSAKFSLELLECISVFSAEPSETLVDQNADALKWLK